MPDQNLEDVIKVAGQEVENKYIVNQERAELFKELKAVIAPENAELQNVENFLKANNRVGEICRTDSATNFLIGVIAEVFESEKSDAEKLKFIKDVTQDMSHLESPSASKEQDMQLLLIASTKHKENANFGGIIQECLQSMFPPSQALQNFEEEEIVKHLAKKAKEDSPQNQEKIELNHEDAQLEALKQALEKQKKKKSFLDDIEPTDVAKAGFSIGALIALSVVFPGVGTLMGLAVVGAVYATTSEKGSKEEQKDKVEEGDGFEEVLAKMTKNKAPSKSLEQEPEISSKQSHVAQATQEVVEQVDKEATEQKSTLGRILDSLSNIVSRSRTPSKEVSATEEQQQSSRNAKFSFFGNKEEEAITSSEQSIAERPAVESVQKENSIPLNSNNSPKPTFPDDESWGLDKLFELQEVTQQLRSNTSDVAAQEPTSLPDDPKRSKDSNQI